MEIDTQKRSIERMKGWMLVAVVIAYCVTLLPMFAIARYNVPFGDDQLFGSGVGTAFAETGSFGAAVKEACRVVANYYENWQGTYAAIFLMALHPGVFGVQYYGIAPYFLIAALTASTLFLAGTIGKRLLHANGKAWLLPAFLILLFSVQFPPSAREAFYWYNGAIYYTFFHCLLLCMTAILIRMRTTAGRGCMLACGVLCLLLAAVIAGGNYATALPAGAILFGNVLLYALPWWNKGAERNARTLRLLFAVAAFLIFCVGMLVSVAAPGNAVRQASVNNDYTGMSAPVAIAVSFPLAFAAVLNRLDIGAVLLIAVLLLVLPPYLAKTRWSFAHPALAVALAFCVYASQFTPTLYAAGSPGPHRLRNIEFFNFYWLISFATVYVTGAAIRRREKDGTTGAGLMPGWSRAALWLAARPVLPVLLSACLVGAMFLQRDLTKTPVYQSVVELSDGTAAAHAEKRKNRLLPPEAWTDSGDARESKLLS